MSNPTSKSISKDAANIIKSLEGQLDKSADLKSKAEKFDRLALATTLNKLARLNETQRIDYIINKSNVIKAAILALTDLPDREKSEIDEDRPLTQSQLENMAADNYYDSIRIKAEKKYLENVFKNNDTLKDLINTRAHANNEEVMKKLARTCMAIDKCSMHSIQLFFVFMKEFVAHMDNYIKPVLKKDRPGAKKSHEDLESAMRLNDIFPLSYCIGMFPVMKTLITYPRFLYSSVTRDILKLYNDKFLTRMKVKDDVEFWSTISDEEWVANAKRSGLLNEKVDASTSVAHAKRLMAGSENIIEKMSNITTFLDAMNKCNHGETMEACIARLKQAKKNASKKRKTQ